MHPPALRIKVMAACAAQELQVPIRFVSEDKYWRSIHDMLASEAAFIGSERVSGKAYGRARHATCLARLAKCRQWVGSGLSALECQD